MSQIKQITARAIPLVGDDIDTDRIIPARFLRCVTFEGLGKEVFKDDRQQASGNHPFDAPQYQGANILVANANFGCGSSREHAPQSLSKWGIKAIIAESFAEIFFGNCVVLGLPCLKVEPEVSRKLQQDIANLPNQQITIDLENLSVTWSGGSAKVTIDEGSRQSLLSGTWDSCAQLLKNKAAIDSTGKKIPYLAWR